MNAIYNIKEGINKNGKPFSYITFTVHTSCGDYTTSPIFPSPLELAVLKQNYKQSNSAGNNASNSDATGISSIYSISDTSLEAEF